MSLRSGLRADLAGVAVAAAVLASLAALALATRPPLPVSEARTLTVAWEMWLDGQWLVPHLNGQPYPDKPPVLFWAILAGWSLIGPSETWARLVVPLFGAGALGATAWVARLLWPGRGDVAGLAPVLLVGMPLFAVMGTVAFFDVPLALFALLALAGVLLAWRGRPAEGWALFGIATGLGILTKGPVALVFALPAPLLAPWWASRGGAPSWPRWYADFAIGVGFAAAIAMAWVLPAAQAGGSAYADAILWRQTAGRIAGSFAHAQPWWWYLPMLPLALYPWAWWPALWRAASGERSLLRADPAVRLLLAGAIAPLVVLSAISGKQPNYLVPLLPLVALLAARLVADAPAPRARDALVPLAPLALAAVLGLAAAAFGPDIAGGAGTGAGALLERIAMPGPLLLAAGVVALAAAPWRKRPPGAVRVVAASILAIVAIHVTFAGGIRALYDPMPAARFVAEAQAAGRPVAHMPEYEGYLGFAGRLAVPVAEVAEPDLPAWARGHADGFLIAYPRAEAVLPAEPAFRQPFRGRTLAIWPAEAVARYGVAALRGD